MIEASKDGNIFDVALGKFSFFIVIQQLYLTQINKTNRKFMGEGK